MRGHVARRGKTWSYVIDVAPDPATGRRRQRSKGGFPTKGAAEDAMREAIAKGSSSGKGSQRLGDYLAEWIVTVRPRLRETTFNGYQMAVDRVTAGLGAVRMDDLTRSEEHTSELQSLMRLSYAVFCLNTKHRQNKPLHYTTFSTTLTPLSTIMNTNST